jgi:hypothetical protein
MDQLLFKMVKAGDIAKHKRGKYERTGKIDKKESFDPQAAGIVGQNAPLTDLTDLTA